MNAFDLRSQLIDRLYDIRETLGDKAVLNELLISMSNGELAETVDYLERMFDLEEMAEWMN